VRIVKLPDPTTLEKRFRMVLAENAAYAVVMHADDQRQGERYHSPNLKRLEITAVSQTAVAQLPELFIEKFRLLSDETATHVQLSRQLAKVKNPPIHLVPVARIEPLEGSFIDTDQDQIGRRPPRNLIKEFPDVPG